MYSGHNDIARRICYALVNFYAVVQNSRALFSAQKYCMPPAERFSFFPYSIPDSISPNKNC